jgi:hypothetical protein
LAALVVPDAGRLAETGDLWEPYRLLDANGAVVEPVAAFLAELQARDRSASTLRSYGNDLLLWWRWLGAVGVAWDRATRAEARDFARWMQVADKPARVHWRYRDGRAAAVPAGAGTPSPDRGESGDRQDTAGAEVLREDPRSCGDGAAELLRVPP